MAAKQRILQVITQAAMGTAKAAIMLVKEVKNPVNTTRSVQVMFRTGAQALKQSVFDWELAEGKYRELLNFAVDVNNIFIASSYNIQENETIPIILS